MSSIIINSISALFVIITITYFLTNIFLNRALYNYIKSDYEKLTDDYKRSLLYQNTKNRYSNYILENTNGELSITSFIEEICTSFTFKNVAILDRIKNIKNASSTCILLGVLGTFVGLSFMLLSVNTNDIINSLPASISSMQTAFITSICGIVCSILLNLIISKNDCENILVKLMLRLENIITSEVSHIKSKQMDEKIEDIKNTIKEINKSMEAIEHFDQISDELKTFNKEFINGIELLKVLLDDSQNSIKTFDQSIRKLDKQFSIMNLKFVKLFDKYDNQTEINKEILIDIKETSKNINASTENQLKIKDYIKSINANFDIYEKNAQDILLKLTHNERDLLDEEARLDKTIQSLTFVLDNLSKEIAEKINMLIDFIDNAQLEAEEIRDKENVYEEIYDIESLADLDGDDLSND